MVHRANNVTIDDDPSRSMWGNARVELVAWVGAGEGPLTLQPYQLVISPQGAWVMEGQQLALHVDALALSVLCAEVVPVVFNRTRARVRGPRQGSHLG